MSVQEETLRLKFELAGEAKIAELERQIRAVREEEKNLQFAAEAGVLSAADYTREIARLDAAYAGLKSRLADAKSEAKAAAQALADQANVIHSASGATYELADAYDLVDRAETRVVTSAKAAGTAIEASTARMAASLNRSAATMEAGLDRSKSKVAGLGQSFLQTGRVVQDFAQGGIGGVLNNIEGLTMALGGAAGVAGALTVVGVGLALFAPKIKAWVGQFVAGTTEVRDGLTALKERVKELEEKPVKLAVDVHELKNAQKDLDTLTANLAAFKAAQESRNQFEKESGQQVTEILAEESPGGEKAVADQLKASLIKAAVERSQTIREAMKEAAEQDARAADLAADPNAAPGLATQAHEQAEAARERSSKARQAIEQEAEGTAGGMIRGAKAGDADAQGRLARQLRAAGQDDLAESIESNSPDALKAYDESERAFEHANEAAKQRRIERQKREADEKARKRNVAAAQDKELADAVRDADRQSDDQKATAKDDLVADMPKGAVKARMKAAIRAELDKADEIRAEIRDAVAEEVSEKFLSGIGKRDVAKARATGDTRAARDAKAADAKATKDRKDLVDGLGEDFLAGADASRMALELDPQTTARDRAQFRAALLAMARARLKAAGHDDATAGRLAGGAGALVDADVQQRMNMARADAGAPNAPAALAMAAAYRSLVQQLGNRPRANPKAAPRVKIMKRRGGVTAPRPVPPAAPKPVPKPVPRPAPKPAPVPAPKPARGQTQTLAEQQAAATAAAAQNQKLLADEQARLAAQNRRNRAELNRVARQLQQQTRSNQNTGP